MLDQEHFGTVTLGSIRQGTPPVATPDPFWMGELQARSIGDLLVSEIKDGASEIPERLAVLGIRTIDELARAPAFTAARMRPNPAIPTLRASVLWRAKARLRVDGGR